MFFSSLSNGCRFRRLSLNSCAMPYQARDFYWKWEMFETINTTNVSSWLAKIHICTICYLPNVFVLFFLSFVCYFKDNKSINQLTPLGFCHLHEWLVFSFRSTMFFDPYKGLAQKDLHVQITNIIIIFSYPTISIKVGFWHSMDAWYII